MAPVVLFLSNGHGEDLIASTIAARVRELVPSIELLAYPVVGYGDAYRRAEIPVVGVQQAMPTGGFILKGPGNLWKDLKAGLIRLTLRQIRDLKERRARLDGVVAVGDIYALLLAGRYVRRRTLFVATAKSEYIEGHFGWEYALMRRYAAHVYARDPLTAQAMARRGVSAEFVGNVMMDALPTWGSEFDLPPGARVVTLLPGSRQDAYDNARDLLRVVDALEGRGEKLGYLMSLAPSLAMELLIRKAREDGWKTKDDEPVAIAGGTRFTLFKDGQEVVCVQGAFGDLLHRADIVVGLAGTGNEQAAGLGKPVVTFPGVGTQFTPKFARDQKRLLGDAVSLVARDPAVVAEEVRRILADPALYARMATVGRERMGEPGGALKMARRIVELFRP